MSSAGAGKENGFGMEGLDLSGEVNAFGIYYSYNTLLDRIEHTRTHRLVMHCSLA